jgi:hypothetical protein
LDNILFQKCFSCHNGIKVNNSFLNELIFADHMAIDILIYFFKRNMFSTTYPADNN